LDQGGIEPVYKKGNKLDFTNYRDVCLLNAKVFYDRLLSSWIPVRKINDMLHQILEKGNEYNI
jgi:hypothetical protein